MYIKTKLLKTARATCPGLGHSRAGDILVHQGLKTGGLAQGFTDTHPVPPGQQGRLHHGTFIQIYRAGDSNAKSGDLGRIYARLFHQNLYLRRDAGDDVGGVPARGGHPGMPDNVAQQVKDYESDHGRVQMNAHGIHTGRVQPQDGPRLARTRTFLACLDNQLLIQQAPGNIGNGLGESPTICASSTRLSPCAERRIASRMTVRLKSPIRGRFVPRLGVGCRISVTDAPRHSEKLRRI